MRILALAVLFVVGCSNLPAKDQVCGNGVIDRGEDCDNSSQTCEQCRLLCPGGYDTECAAWSSGNARSRGPASHR